MANFVDECRREWKRLGVPCHVRSEMAAELEADLAEGSSLEDVVAGDAADARVFAQTWAAERGVIPKRPWSRLPAALAVPALALTITGAVLTIHDSRSTLFGGPSGSVSRVGGVWVADSAPAENAVAQARLSNARPVLISSTTRANDDSTQPGAIVLLVGLGLLVPLTLYSSARIAFGR
jgi:hypothetical protein